MVAMEEVEVRGQIDDSNGVRVSGGEAVSSFYIGSDGVGTRLELELELEREHDLGPRDQTHSRADLELVLEHEFEPQHELGLELGLARGLVQPVRPGRL